MEVEACGDSEKKSIFSSAWYCSCLIITTHLKLTNIIISILQVKRLGRFLYYRCHVASKFRTSLSTGIQTLVLKIFPQQHALCPLQCTCAPDRAWPSGLYLCLAGARMHPFLTFPATFSPFFSSNHFLSREDVQHGRCSKLRTFGWISFPFL